MPATTKVPLGASTLNRMYYLDVDTTPATSPTWVAVNGVKEFKPVFESDLQDDSDFDSDGYKSSTKTAEEWSLETTLVRKVTAADATAYDPGQEFLRDHSVGKMGSAARVHVRFYEMTEGRWPTAPGEAELIADLELARDLGYTLVRKHLTLLSA